MPEASKRVWQNVAAAIGYLITFCACLLGTALTLAVLGVLLGFRFARPAGRRPA